MNCLLLPLLNFLLKRSWVNSRYETSSALSDAIRIFLCVRVFVSHSTH